MEQIRSKEKYQFRQIFQSRQNIMQHRLTSSPGAKMGEDQLAGIKTMLEQDGLVCQFSHYLCHGKVP